MGVFKILGEVLDAIVETFCDAVFWVIGAIFDLIGALGNLIESTIEWIENKIGSFFATEKHPGQTIICPPDKEVEILIGKYVQGPAQAKYKRGVRNGKTTIAVTKDGHGKIVDTRIVGADKGFDAPIAEQHRRGRTYSVDIS